MQPHEIALFWLKIIAYIKPSFAKDAPKNSQKYQVKKHQAGCR
jgi:hypothetical protein